jgi:hypothetical protein
MNKLLFLLLALVPLLLVLPLNVNAQLPFLPNIGNLTHLPIVQPTTNLTAQPVNKTSLEYYIGSCNADFTVSLQNNLAAATVFASSQIMDCDKNIRQGITNGTIDNTKIGPNETLLSDAHYYLHQRYGPTERP